METNTVEVDMPETDVPLKHVDSHRRDMGQRDFKYVHLC